MDDYQLSNGVASPIEGRDDDPSLLGFSDMRISDAAPSSDMRTIYVGLDPNVSATGGLRGSDFQRTGRSSFMLVPSADSTLVVPAIPNQQAEAMDTRAWFG